MSSGGTQFSPKYPSSFISLWSLTSHNNLILSYSVSKQKGPTCLLTCIGLWHSPTLSLVFREFLKNKSPTLAKYKVYQKRKLKAPDKCHNPEITFWCASLQMISIMTSSSILLIETAPSCRETSLSLQRAHTLITVQSGPLKIDHEPSDTLKDLINQKLFLKLESQRILETHFLSWHLSPEGWCGWMLTHTYTYTRVRHASTHCFGIKIKYLSWPGRSCMGTCCLHLHCSLITPLWTPVFQSYI